MPKKSQNTFRNKMLTPDLITARFKVQTNWHVITGAPCSGKTTLIELLEKEGFHTVPEAGREFFECEFAKGRTLDEIRGDPAKITRQIYEIMKEREIGQRVDEVTFFDRGLPDAPAFYRMAGMDPDEVIPDCFQHRYASVFILDRLPYQLDGVRAADDETAAYFDVWTERDYIAVGYEVVRVPVLPPIERLHLVLESVFGN